MFGPAVVAVFVVVVVVVLLVVEELAVFLVVVLVVVFVVYPPQLKEITAKQMPVTTTRALLIFINWIPRLDRIVRRL